MNNTILTIKNLSKTYYTKKDETIAIEDFSFNIKEKSIIAIVGPSGCGKSTLLNIIGNLDKKTSGEITLEIIDGKINSIKLKNSDKELWEVAELLIKDKDTSDYGIMVCKDICQRLRSKVISFENLSSKQIWRIS